MRNWNLNKLLTNNKNNMENTVNTMTITLDEYKKMIDEVAHLQSRIAGKDENISSLHAEMGRLNAEIDRLEEKVSEAQTSVYIQGADRYCSSPYGSYVKLSKESPELEKLITEATNKAQEDTIKSQLKKIEDLQDKVERLEKQWNTDRKNLIEKQTAKVEELNKTIDTLTKDYEDLKLDKAANIVEAERLAEINELKEHIVDLEANGAKGNEYMDITFNLYMDWLPNNLFTRLFHKQIKRYAQSLYNHMKSVKTMRTINTTSAYGKAKDYLKTLENKSTNNWIDANIYGTSSTTVCGW